ncbi:secretin N-terminal domain-containing protein [Neochlamydia sp. EPS4]|uniref:secretin N-terminal domain-containing protein n=1 Tax=Neochlamydia sp. EPS4 TaxID=1478175 RepID=UPI00138E2114|nr:secretin N-terminal domain-containing protein [Neochlamydia sp. EPS4]
MPSTLPYGGDEALDNKEIPATLPPLAISTPDSSSTQEKNESPEIGRFFYPKLFTYPQPHTADTLPEGAQPTDSLNTANQPASELLPTLTQPPEAQPASLQPPTISPPQLSTTSESSSSPQGHPSFTTSSSSTDLPSMLNPTSSPEHMRTVSSPSIDNSASNHSAGFNTPIQPPLTSDSSSPQTPSLFPSSSPPLFQSSGPSATNQDTTSPNSNIGTHTSSPSNFKPLTASPANTNEPPKTILINFNNVAITEYIRFISRISNKNFVFDENDLQFTVTIVSEEPTTIDNIMTALLQELRIHDLELIEQENTIIIHRNSKVAGISKVVTEDGSVHQRQSFDIITKVFRLNTLEAERAALILKPMISANALVEVLKETNHLIITDLSSNIREISALLNSLDSPQSGLVIGQYVVRSQSADALIALAGRIIQPIAQDQKINFISHKAANSIFIVGSPYLVERTLSILKYLDQTGATTQIINPKDLNFGTKQQTGQWILDKNGNWQFIPEAAVNGRGPPKGNWKIDEQGNWYFEPGEPIPDGKGPDGKWVLDKDGNWVFQLNPGKPISPQKVQRKERIDAELPVGHIERTQFSIYKLQYRKGEQIAKALARIAESLTASGAGTNTDLLASINSVQWIESSNSLIFTGTSDAIDKMRELLGDIDVPLRQVLLEMLILETDITDSLNFSTNVASNFGGGNTSGAEAFLSGASTLPAGMASSGLGLIPNAAAQATSVSGFVLGVIGQTITHNGKEYATLGGLVKALTQRSMSRIIMNPKILTEDNSPAEVFVGLNTQFPTQSIANNLGTILTQNFEFRDVGTNLKVTPIIGSNDIVTLEIQEEVSSIVSGGISSSSTATSQIVGPTTKINRTTTKVHVPNKFFLILSGMVSDTDERNRTQVPCLGSIPVLGAAFSDKQVKNTKQNLMIFIHPIILDTEEEIDNITRHQQNIYRVKSRRPKEWVCETDEAMDFFNIINTENSDGSEDRY